MLKELIIIFAVNYAGIIISTGLNLPIPGTIIGMLLFFLLLYFKIIKVEKIERATSLLLLNMTIFFLPPAVKIMDNIQHLSGNFLKAVFIIILTTFLTMGITGKVVELMIKLMDKKNPKTSEKEGVIKWKKY